MLRFDPFRELDRLASVAFDGNSSASLPMDVIRSANEVRVYFDLPGVDPDSVDLTVERNRLTLKATRRWELGEGDRLVVRERPSGDFSRTLVLSEGLDTTRVTAHYEHGVLVLTLPVAELAQPRKISVGGGRNDSGSIPVESSATIAGNGNGNGAGSVPAASPSHAAN
jgi:HSP20 family protein